MRMIRMDINNECCLKVRKGLMKQIKRKPMMMNVDAFIT